MNKFLKFSAVAALAAFAGVVSANAAIPVIANFDDLTGFDSNTGIGVIPSGYQNLTWSNFGAYSSLNLPTDVSSNGVVSSNNAALNLDGNESKISLQQNALGRNSFTLNSIYLTAASDSPVSLEITGYFVGLNPTTGKVLKGVPITGDKITFTLSSTPTKEIFNWSGLSYVTFHAVDANGIQIPSSDTGVATTGVLFDNVVVTGPAVPEPSTWVALAAALGGVAFMARSRRSSVAQA